MDVGAIVAQSGGVIFGRALPVVAQLLLQDRFTHAASFLAISPPVVEHGRPALPAASASGNLRLSRLRCLPILGLVHLTGAVEAVAWHEPARSPPPLPLPLLPPPPPTP